MAVWSSDAACCVSAWWRAALRTRGRSFHGPSLSLPARRPNPPATALPLEVSQTASLPLVQSSHEEVKLLSDMIRPSRVGAVTAHRKVLWPSQRIQARATLCAVWCIKTSVLSEHVLLFVVFTFLCFPVKILPAFFYEYSSVLDFNIYVFVSNCFSLVSPESPLVLLTSLLNQRRVSSENGLWVAAPSKAEFRLLIRWIRF